MDDGQTSEVKSVKRQGLTRQLKTQKEASNSNGKKPRLTINRDAPISKPLPDVSFDITTYSAVPVVPKVDNTRVNNPHPGVQQKEPNLLKDKSGKVIIF